MRLRDRFFSRISTASGSERVSINKLVGGNALATARGTDSGFERGGFYHRQGLPVKSSVRRRTSTALQYVSPRRVAGVWLDAALHKRQHLHATARHGSIFWQQSGEREVACQPGRFDKHGHSRMRRAGPDLFQHGRNLLGADIERNQIVAIVTGCGQFF